MEVEVNNHQPMQEACDAGSTPGSGRFPGVGPGYRLQYSFLENPMGRVGYSPWGHKELDRTEVI